MERHVQCIHKLDRAGAKQVTQKENLAVKFILNNKFINPGNLVSPLPQVARPVPEEESRCPLQAIQPQQTKEKAGVLVEKPTTALAQCQPTEDMENRSKEELIQLIMTCKEQIKACSKEEKILKRVLKRKEKEEEVGNIKRLEAELRKEREMRKQAEQQIRQLKSKITTRPWIETQDDLPAVFDFSDLDFIFKN